MSSLKKPLFAVITVMIALLASFSIAGGSASAAPAPPSGYNGGGGQTITVSTNPKCGSKITVSGKGYTPGARIVIKVNGVEEVVTHADSDGRFKASFKLICHGQAGQTISASGGGGVDSQTLHPGIAGGGGTGGTGGGSGSGGLSSTGVAVVGIGAVGVVLMLGGGLLLLAGKRRRIIA